MKSLYDDDVIRIEQAKTPEEHDLYVGNQHYYLSRGILKECAEVDSEELGTRLWNINSEIISRIQNVEKISLERLGWAFAKARIKELEEEISYFIRESQEAKEDLWE